MKALAQKFEIHRATVSEHLNTNGVQRRQRGLNPQQVNIASRLYKSGRSLRRVGELLGVDGETVRQALMKTGVDIRERGGRTSSAIPEDSD